jgi:hypothetical protein
MITFGMWITIGFEYEHFILGHFSLKLKLKDSVRLI